MDARTRATHAPTGQYLGLGLDQTCHIAAEYESDVRVAKLRY